MMVYLMANIYPYLRLQKQELISTLILDVDTEDSVVTPASNDLNSALEEACEVQAKPVSERAKIIISIQEKDNQKQFRVYKVHYYIYAPYNSHDLVLRLSAPYSVVYFTIVHSLSLLFWVSLRWLSFCSTRYHRFLMARYKYIKLKLVFTL